MTGKWTNDENNESTSLSLFGSIPAFRTISSSFYFLMPHLCNISRTGNPTMLWFLTYSVVVFIHNILTLLYLWNFVIKFPITGNIMTNYQIDNLLSLDLITSFLFCTTKISINVLPPAFGVTSLERSQSSASGRWRTIFLTIL